MTDGNHALQPVPANLGYIAYPVWILVPPRPSNKDLVIRFKDALLDSVEVFTADSSGFTRYASCGLLMRKRHPAIQDAFPCFITSKELNAKVMLIRIRTSDVCAVEPEVFEYASFVEMSRLTNGLYGLYFGAVFILAIINLFLFVSAKFTSSLWYSLWILMFAAFQAFASGLIELRYVFYNPSIVKNGTAMFACLTWTFGSLFIIDFLSLNLKDKVSKAFKTAFLLFASFGFLLAMTAIAGHGTFSSKTASTVVPVFITTILTIGIIRIKTLGRPAIFFIAAVCVLATGNVINSLRNLSVLPNSFFASHGNIIGSVFEFLIIAVALVDRISTIEKRRNEAYRQVQYANQLVAESRLKTLQAQINPHFLFNTLNTLAELVTMMPEQAEKLVIALSKFFRYTLTASEQKMVKLQDEIEIVKTYLSIEKARYGERLEYDIDLTGTPGNTLILGLILQPIVENSIKHGIATVPKGGKVALKFVVTPNTIHITVHDNGPGFGGDKNSAGTSHGLYNVRERLKLTYGGEAQLTCRNMNGAFVELVVPARGATGNTP
jgi:sensor histidine kinase YesM